MSGYELLRIKSDINTKNGYVDRISHYAELVTPSGTGAIVGRSAEVKSGFFGGFSMDRANEELEKLRNSMRKEGWQSIPDFENFLTKPLGEGAPSQEYEYCLVYDDLRFHGGAPETTYLAYQLTPHQAVYLDADPSPEKLTPRLETAGWKTIDKEAKGGLLKRRIEASETGGKDSTGRSEDPLETLKKLGELRDAGIVTEEEFQAKKKDLLGQL